MTFAIEDRSENSSPDLLTHTESVSILFHPEKYPNQSFHANEKVNCQSQSHRKEKQGSKKQAVCMMQRCNLHASSHGSLRGH